jgi:GNAT superfamily N-acetyltransferase
MRELRLDDDTFLDLSAEILRQGGSFQFRAHGSSMAPFIRDGDLLTMAPCDPADLAVGDVTLYRTHRDRVVAHRIVAKSVQRGQWTLVTQGDARLHPDSPVPGDRLLGRIVRIQRGDRIYHVDRGPWRLAARLWLWLLPLRRAAARLVRAVKTAALRALNSLQSLRLYRRLARSILGQRALVRRADARDASALARLFGSETLPGLREPVGALAARTAEEGGLALVAVIGSSPAGRAVVRRFPDGDPLYPGWWLLGPVVRARYRRAGIARALLRRALSEAAEAGATWVYLLAAEDDAATRSLAQQAGFLPASLPALQARLDELSRTGEPRRIILACAVQSRKNRPRQYAFVPEVET